MLVRFRTESSVSLETNESALRGHLGYEDDALQAEHETAGEREATHRTSGFVNRMSEGSRRVCWRAKKRRQRGRRITQVGAALACAEGSTPAGAAFWIQTRARQFQVFNDDTIS